MQIIPVIDLKDQLVVHAQQGKREQYRPINSKLCPQTEISAVIEAYLTLYPFEVFYLADLNAIAGNLHNQAIIKAVLHTYPKLTFWIDSGYQEAPSLYQHYANYLPVLGSESYTDSNYKQLANFQANCILSLDFAADSQLGAEAIFQQQALWPEKVIIMNLKQVGSNAGPDFDKLTHYQQHHPQQQFVAAGGVRSLDDLVKLNRMGITSVLVASALHAGNISTSELLRLHKEQG